MSRIMDRIQLDCGFNVKASPFKPKTQAPLFRRTNQQLLVLSCLPVLQTKSTDTLITDRFVDRFLINC